MRKVDREELEAKENKADLKRDVKMPGKLQQDKEQAKLSVSHAAAL